MSPTAKPRKFIPRTGSTKPSRTSRTSLRDAFAQQQICLRSVDPAGAADRPSAAPPAEVIGTVVIAGDFVDFIVDVVVNVVIVACVKQ